MFGVNDEIQRSFHPFKSLGQLGSSSSCYLFLTYLVSLKSVTYYYIGPMKCLIYLKLLVQQQICLSEGKLSEYFYADRSEEVVRGKPVNIYLVKVIIATPEKGVKYVQS